MRVSTLVILLLVVGGVGFVLLFKRDWLFSTIDASRQAASGYTAATSANDCLEKFVKAINSREYRAASKYCSAEYAEALMANHDAAATLGARFDHINNFMKEKGVAHDNSVWAIYLLDPFPKIAVDGPPKKVSDSQYTGSMKLILPLNRGDLTKESGLDPRMYTNPLMQPLTTPQTNATGRLVVDIVAEGQGDAKTWKIKAPSYASTHGILAYYFDKWKTYDTGIEVFQRDMSNGRYASPGDFKAELMQVLSKANPKTR